jgi:hypothetical protein
MLSYLEKSFESDITPAWDKSSKQNNFWLTLVTMTTVGYGDGYPSTHLGRFIMVLSCIFGRFITSLFINSLTENFNHTHNEAKAYSLCKEHFLLERERKRSDKEDQSQRKTSLKHFKRFSCFQSKVTHKSYIISYSEFFRSLKTVIDINKNSANNDLSNRYNVNKLSERLNDLKDNLYSVPLRTKGKVVDSQSKLSIKLAEVKDIVKQLASFEAQKPGLE